MDKQKDYSEFSKLWEPLSIQLGLQEYLMRNIIHKVRTNNSKFSNIERLLSDLKKFQYVKNLCDDPLITETALWFSGIDYSLRKSNYSARIAKNWLNPVFEEAYVEKVAQLVSSVYGMPFNNDSKILHDVKLSFLGDRWDNFMRSRNLLIQDFEEKEVDAYLSNLFKMEKIFYTDYFSSKYENNAHQNIKETIDIII
jgi:predicted metal-dependent HD superfamily phosphohydrolase